MNVILIITMIRYYKRKTSNNVQNPNTFAFKRTDLNNSKIALFMNFLSALSHISIFSLFILIRFLSFGVFRILSQIIGILCTIRHSVNFFLFLKLNKKFRRNFYVLIPRCLLKFIRRNNVRPINHSSPKCLRVEHVNIDHSVMTTKL